MKRLLHVLLALVGSVAGFIALLAAHAYFTTPDVSYLKTTNPQTTAFMEYRQKEAKRSGRTLRIRHRWISLRRIPKILQRTIIVAEDAAFWVHNGVDWDEMRNALHQNWEEKRIVRGASTITQQTAKNLFLSPHRNLYRKIKEFFIARELEKHLSKRRILEIYLNSIEFGRGIFGIYSASQYYFGKSPGELTLSEMVRLAAIIPAPLRLSPTRPNRELRWRSFVILRRLYKHGFINRSQFQYTEGKLKRFFSSGKA